MQSENFAEPSAPDSVPDELITLYGRKARRTVKHNLSRRSRLARKTRRVGRLLRGSDSDVWQTTAVVFSLSVIVVCGIGALAYAVYLWPKIGLTLTSGVLVLFLFSYLVARRVTRRRADPGDDQITLF